MMHAFTPILAEVSDKVATIGNIWLCAAVASLIFLLASAWSRRAGFVALPLAALWALLITEELRDPFVGPAIVRELGQGYIMQSYVAAAVPAVFAAIGLWRPRKHAA